MPVGLQVWAPDGRLRLELTDRLTRFHSTHLLDYWIDDSTRFIPVSDMVDDGLWMVIAPAPDFIAMAGNGGVTVWSQGTGNTTDTKVPITIYRT